MGNFDPESHFNSKIKGKSLYDSGNILGLSLPRIERNRVVDKGIPRVCRENYKYSEFVKINIKHGEYLKEMLRNQSANMCLHIISKADLTGAEMTVESDENRGVCGNGHRRVCGNGPVENSRRGIVAEERKNSLVLIFPDDRTRIYPKAMWNFKMEVEGKEYLFIGKNLKQKRTG